VVISALDNAPLLIGQYDMLGGRGGISVGADYRFASGGFIGAELTGSYGMVNGDLGITLEGSLNMEVAARLRVGWMFSPELAVYATGGIVGATFEQELLIGPGAGQKVSQFVVGGQVGAGMEYFFTPNIGLYGEYVLSYYDDQSLAYVDRRTQVDPTSHAARLGLRYRF
jgi:opacity protein-like surface antigen